jgi:hypothetical protein
LPEKIHPIPSYLPDNLSPLRSRSFAVAIDAVLPVHRPFPAFPGLLRAAVWTRWKRRNSSAGLQLAGASRAFLVELRRRALRLAVGELLAVSQ